MASFVVRLYFYAGSEQIKIVHSFVYDGDQNKDFIRALGIRMDAPMREALYNRHVAFSCANGGVWSEPVQPLAGRRKLTLGKEDTLSLQQQQMDGKRIPPYEAFDGKNRDLLDNWASWNDYRLSQLSADAFSIRKRANDNNPWIGTFSGTRSGGYAFVGDITGGLGLCCMILAVISFIPRNIGCQNFICNDHSMVMEPRRRTDGLTSLR